MRIEKFNLSNFRMLARDKLTKLSQIYQLMSTAIIDNGGLFRARFHVQSIEHYLYEFK